MAGYCTHCSAAPCMLCVSKIDVALPRPHTVTPVDVPWSKLACVSYTQQPPTTLVLCSCLFCGERPPHTHTRTHTLTSLADGAALIRLILRVHTLRLWAGCHRTQHLAARFTPALLARRHLQKKKQLTPIRTHTDTHNKGPLN